MKPFDFRIQRISRMYFWGAWIISNALNMGVNLLLAVEYENHDPAIMFVFMIILFTVHMLYQILLVIKRFHDVGKSTGYAVFCILLVPFLVGDILIFYVVGQKSDDDNIWGKNEEKAMFERERDYYAR